MRTVRMGEGRDALWQEIDAYIRLHLRPEGGKIRDFFGRGAETAATRPSIGDARWALNFLLKKLEPTFSEKLMQLIEDPAEIVEAIFSFYEGRGFLPTREERQKMLNL